MGKKTNAERRKDRGIHRLCVVVLAEVFANKPPKEMEIVVRGVVRHLNRCYGTALAMPFTAKATTEFRGAVADPLVIPNLVWDIERETRPLDVRIGLGLELPREEWLARVAMAEARIGGRCGGVFAGFGAWNGILDGYARLLHQVRRRLTDSKREALELVRQGLQHHHAAERLGITKQAFSQRVEGYWKPLWRGNRVGGRRCGWLLSVRG